MPQKKSLTIKSLSNQTPKEMLDKSLMERLEHFNSLSLIIYKALNLSPTQCNIWAIKSMRELTIMTDDNLLATRIRFEQENIKRYLKQHKQLSIQHIKIRLSYPNPAPTYRPVRAGKMKLSYQSAEIISSVAHSISDEPLKQAMLNIAKLAKSS